MMSPSCDKLPIAMITGGNRGIGYGIVKQMCKEFHGVIIFTARSKEAAEQSHKKLMEETEGQRRCEVLVWKQLDISSVESIIALRQAICEEYNGLDILINNAAMAYHNDDTTPFSIQASTTITTNYFGTFNMMREFIPLMRKCGRVINVSSSVGTLNCVNDPMLKSRLLSPTLTLNEVHSLMQSFIGAAQHEDDESGNNLEKAGFKKNAYAMSKLGVTLMSFLMQRIVDIERSDTKILVIPCCPGYVKTDMTRHKGNKTIEEGADTPVFLAISSYIEIEHRFKYKFVADRTATSIEG